MATLEISCPQCGNTSKVPDELIGKKIKCRKCQNIIVVKAASQPAPKNVAVKAEPKAKETKKPGPHDDDDRTPYVMREENLAARCPFCAQLMDPPDAKICIHCGYHMQKRQRVESKKTYEHTAADYLLWHLPTVGYFVGIFVLIGINVYCVMNMDGWVGDEAIVKPGCFSLWIVIPSCFAIFLMARFIFKRLVWHIIPPEKVKLDKGDVPE